jgi:hypothetical protein
VSGGKFPAFFKEGSMRRLAVPLLALGLVAVAHAADPKLFDGVLKRADAKGLVVTAGGKEVTFIMTPRTRCFEVESPFTCALLNKRFKGKTVRIEHAGDSRRVATIVRVTSRED